MKESESDLREHMTKPLVLGFDPHLRRCAARSRSSRTRSAGESRELGAHRASAAGSGWRTENLSLQEFCPPSVRHSDDDEDEDE